MKKFSIVVLDFEIKVSIVKGTLPESHCSRSEPPKILSLSFSYQQSLRTVEFKFVTLVKNSATLPSTNLMGLVQSHLRVGMGSNGWAPDFLFLLSKETRRLGLSEYSGWTHLSDLDKSDVRMTEVLHLDFGFLLASCALYLPFPSIKS